MAFSYKIKSSDFMGQGVCIGCWTADGVTTGLIQTGFNHIEHMKISNYASDTATCKATGGNVNMTCTANDGGTFMIYGY